MTLSSPSTGLTRTLQVGADGNFRASGLPVGTYNITVQRQDGTTATRENVVVNVGSNTAVDFTAGDATSLERITVTATSISPIDVSSVESTTILTEATLDRLPVQRNVTAAALLAPGTTQGDTAFGNLASFGGSTVGENAYYVNGFNITDFRRGLGFSTLPYEFISEQQIKTGGFGAEFGRSTGGVINIATKRGSNEWRFGGNVIWEPSGARESSPDTFTADGTLVSSRSRDSEDDLTANAYVSGPLIRDRLFFYAIGELRDNEREDVTLADSNRIKSDDPFWGAKVDWYITDDHRLEYTGFSDGDDETTDVVPFDPNGLPGTIIETTGGRTDIFKYTGYLTDDFTLSALYGKGELEGSQTSGENDACPFIIDRRSGVSIRRGCGVLQIPTIEQDERTAYRIDAEWGIGDHFLRFGYDREDLESYEESVSSGGELFVLRPDGLIQRRVYENIGGFETESTAFYVEDIWNVTDDLLLSLGLRNESFDNKNINGESFIEIDDQWAPRLGLAWDIGGTATKKLFANAGRYYLPVATNTNVRLGGAELFFDQIWTISGIRDDFTPILDELVVQFDYSNGEAKDVRTIVNQDIDPMYQDEFIIGYQQEIFDKFAVGVKVIHRDLKSTLEDIAIDAALNQYAADNGFDDFEAGGFDYYVLTNPGRDMRVSVDLDGDGVLEDVSLTAAQLGYPESTRKYNAVEFFFDRAWDGSWFLQGSYTWSKSYGNNEGFVRSDNGQGDAGLTTLFDQPGLLDGAYGNLPNDRRHQVKVFGAWQVSENVLWSANLLARSGRPISCFGNHPTDEFAFEYGSESFYCDLTDDGVENSVLYPRGSFGETDWVYQFDLGFEYRPTWAAKRFAVKLDIFNVFDSQSETEVFEVGEEDFAIGFPNATFLLPSAYQEPRSVRVALSYDW